MRHSIPVVVFGLLNVLIMVACSPASPPPSENDRTPTSESSSQAPADDLESVAAHYLASWAGRDYASMWSVCSPDQLFISARVLELALHGFPVRLEGGEILGVRSDVYPDRAEVEYRILGPSEGCLLLILREADPAYYGEFFAAVPPDTYWEGTLTLRKVDGQWKIVTDTNRLVRDAYFLNALSFSAMVSGGSLKREQVFASYAAGAALEKGLSAREFMDTSYPLMKACHAEVFQGHR